jgi:2-hydroxy-6-oxonona-2,4-dienedioate hydrolase
MADSEIEINGGIVVYEFVGPEDAEVVVLTPGGRFSKDFPGVHELANALADGGKRVLLWDRPNCGKSDIQLYGQSESHMRAETLGLMLKKLGIEQVISIGGSGGARDSIIFTMMWPDMVRKLAVWSIVGGNYSSIALAGVYVMNELRTVRAKGIEGVLVMPGAAGSWTDLIAVNPRNRDRLLAIGSEGFERVMNRWLNAFIPKPNEPIPGVSDWEFDQIKVPTLIIRGGERDFDHPKRTSMEVHCLIKGSRLIEPPWPEDAWEQGQAAREAGTGNIFDPWVQAAPVLLEFMDEPAGAH